MEANLSGAIFASGCAGLTTVHSGGSPASGFFLRPFKAINQTEDGQGQMRDAGNDNGVVKNRIEHDAGSFLRAFSMITLYAFIGVLYIDENAKVSVSFLCAIICMCYVYLYYVCAVCMRLLWVRCFLLFAENMR